MRTTKDAYERYKKFVETEGVDDASLKEALELLPQQVRPMRFSGLMGIWIRLGRSIYPMWAKPWMSVRFLPDGGCLLPSGNDVMFDNRTHWMTDAEGGNYRVFAIDGSDAQRGDAMGENMIERYCTGNFLAGQRLIYASASGLLLGAISSRRLHRKEPTEG